MGRCQTFNFRRRKRPSEISRKDEIWEGKSGLLTIAGGKLTGYRHMAKGIVDLVSKRLQQEYKLKFKPCETKELKISGGDVGGSANFEQFVKEKTKEGEASNLDAKTAEDIARRYGSNADQLYQIAYTAQYQNSGLPVELYTELVYGIQHEMVYKTD